MLDSILDALLDSLRLVPFLFLTYLLMELLEHKLSDRTLTAIHKAGQYGPAIGGLLGIVPQCGFSAAVANLYAGGVVTRGTLIAVFLSTSDEMLPIFLSENVGTAFILKVVAVKAAAAILVGFAVDWISRQKPRASAIHDICLHEHCGCKQGILRSALMHTLQIFIFIFLLSAAMNVVIGFIGPESLSNLILNQPIVGELLAAVVGLIPNCASSVVITQLYLQGGMRAGAMLSGLLVSSGVGLLILFKMHHNLRDNLLTLAILFISGVALGGLLGLLPIF